MFCEHLTTALTKLSSCFVTDAGNRVTTQCLYPSFDPVHVYVVGFGEGFKVHDGGGATRSAWDHGRDASSIHRAMMRQAAFHQLKIVDGSLVSEVPSSDWLVPAVLAVANASAAAAFSAVEHISSASDDNLRERIFRILTEFVPAKRLERSFEIPGKSGKSHAFDFALRRGSDDWILVDAVSPHHVSIAAKYVAFADTGANGESIAARFAVYDRPLEPDDASLIKQVADLVPFSGLSGGVRREMMQ
ncbi:hypothetical protein [Acidibrevibacterium fodinaquatile]|uniref:hypothetical protein n=1 Tax=Acidibrevibacterium fodinaquatile TaxID=1969806 RepID=UPI0013B3AD79|nr:hypothetical protein [Acidibrevibacterium fodinaquatile]